MKVCPACGLKYPNEETKCFVDQQVLEDLPDEYIGLMLMGRYIIETPIGEGGMATVYRARNRMVDRSVAVKMMSGRLVRDEALRERFRREAKNTAAVAHPNIIDIHDYGETDDGVPFLVMELLEGAPLDSLLPGGPMPFEQVALIGVQIARGLARAHDFGVLHRDLKPENIFLCRDAHGQLSRAKILDFGIARSMHDSRLTSSGEIFGTPQYMAPERVTSIDSGPHADLYALGVILFELVTGRLPFESNDLPGYFIKHLQDMPPKPSEIVPGIPPRFEALILALLEKRPEDRPVDAHAICHWLEELFPRAAGSIPPPPVQGGSPEPAPTLPPAVIAKWQRSHALLSEVIRRGYPSGVYPPQSTQALAEVQTLIAQLSAIRERSLVCQRSLDAMEAQSTERRTRLGHAVHVLAEDLWQAREAARSAQRELQPYWDSAATAQQDYIASFNAYVRLGGTVEVQMPTSELAQAVRGMADGMERWLWASEAAQKAQRWLETKERLVHDLEFQVQALRDQLQHLQENYETERSKVEFEMLQAAKHLQNMEARMIELQEYVAGPLRGRDDLDSMLGELDEFSQTSVRH